jgi:hypothetical protein
MLQNCLELILISLQLGEANLSQGRFILPSNRVKIGIAKEKIRELLKDFIFQFGGREGGGWQRR